ncbi:MAG: DUF3566 domain-containing protein [Actinomycetota bacterium]
MSSSAVTGTPAEGPVSPTPIGRTLDKVSSRDATPVVGIPPVLEAPPPPPPVASDAPEAALRGKVRRAPRRARLYVYRLDAWSVMKVAFMLSVAMAIVIVSAVAGAWYLLDYSGVIATMARNVDEVIGSGTTTFDLEAVLAFDRVMGIAVVVAALEIVLVSILAGIFAVLYNLTVGITGGVEVTFTDAF